MMHYRKSYFHNYLFSILLVGTLFFSCKNDQKKEVAASTGELTGNIAVEVSMENQVFHIEQENLLPVKRTFAKDTILLLFRADENPFQLNLNLTNTNILDKQKAEYKVPGVNSGNIKVDLNFFNADRNVKRTNKRIVFKKGIITIKKLTANKLEMTFTGEGSGMIERDGNFPISGKINASY
ncbi:hypothetical protein [Flagellimonas abyssi]|uniref:Auto-transporter adhesin head GIN domain-containing protein n=1 Tax=Flagellimonas abyssi TaxID=2864871 RepID=A0ABS7EU03_9FLAO|nr:hypothetical protein [Allomuricauda abyssi]MBW8200941.1 hypothetical protein [Allomuricauda abyssi]|tara:strand:+ start:266 stop:808 length:543 start_codon:yes stop_codon:yes gene_type:complete